MHEDFDLTEEELLARIAAGQERDRIWATLHQARGEFLDTFNSLISNLGLIPMAYFLSPGVAFDKRQNFDTYVLAQISDRERIKLVRRICASLGLGEQTREWLRNLDDLLTFRNLIAHGRLTIDYRGIDGLDDYLNRPPLHQAPRTAQDEPVPIDADRLARERARCGDQYRVMGGVVGALTKAGDPAAVFAETMSTGSSNTNILVAQAMFLAG